VAGSAAEEVTKFIVLPAEPVGHAMLLEAAHTSDPSFDPARSARQHRAAAPMSDQLPGDAAGWRYVEFFTANIRNPHTRRAYARACARFSPGARIADLR